MKKRYHDPLHIPSAELVVMHKGKEALILNKGLLDQQNCWENLKAIKDAHSRKLQTYDLINETEDPVMLQMLSTTLTDIEFELQGLWKFPLDGNFHRIWEYPKCECPKMDNLDRYPHGHVISERCPLHGLIK